MEVFEENQGKTRRRTKTEENSEVKMERFNPANSESYRMALSRIVGDEDFVFSLVERRRRKDIVNADNNIFYI
jgi:hypothetical protein